MSQNTQAQAAGRGVRSSSQISRVQGTAAGSTVQQGRCRNLGGEVLDALGWEREQQGDTWMLCTVG